MDVIIFIPDDILGDVIIRRVRGLDSSRGPGGFGVGFVKAGSQGRKQYGKPLCAGPWGYLYGRAGVIDNYGGTAAELDRARTQGTLIDEVGDGDVLVIEGARYVVKVEYDGGVLLEPEDSCPSSHTGIKQCPWCKAMRCPANMQDHIQAHHRG